MNAHHYAKAAARFSSYSIPGFVILSPRSLRPKDPNRQLSKLCPLRSSTLSPERSPPQAHLNRIDPRIRIGHPCIGNMHEAHFHAIRVILAGNVQSQRSARREIYLRSPFRYFRIREQRPTLNFKIRFHFSRRGENPLERERIHSAPICGIGFLNDRPRGHYIERILQPPPQKSRPMRSRQH